MRLIDADKIKQSVTNEMLKAELNSPIYCTLECVIVDIDNQPTAYDVDKVVEQLERNRQNIELIYSTDQGYDYEDAVGIDINKAIEIVKFSGIE